MIDLNEIGGAHAQMETQPVAKETARLFDGEARMLDQTYCEVALAPGERGRGETNLTTCGGHSGRHLRQRSSKQSVHKCHPEEAIENCHRASLSQTDCDSASNGHPSIQDWVREG